MCWLGWPDRPQEQICVHYCDLTGNCWDRSKDPLIQAITNNDGGWLKTQYDLIINLKSKLK